jgi:hypothetical protein
MHLRDELDDRFKRRQWRVQRAGWALLLLIVVLGMLGVFGTSPLAGKIEAVEAGGARYELEYPRFTRYQHHDRIHLRVDAPDAGGEELKVAFAAPLVENAHVGSAFPQPDGSGWDASGAVFTYKVEDWSRPIVLTFEYEPRKAFWNPGHVTVTAGDAEPVELPLAFWVHP